MCKTETVLNFWGACVASVGDFGILVDWFSQCSILTHPNSMYFHPLPRQILDRSFPTSQRRPAPSPLALNDILQLGAYDHNVLYAPAQLTEGRSPQIVKLTSFQKLQHLPTYGTSVAFPLGRLTCVLSRRCQLALDLTARGTGFTHPPLHSPGDCIVVGGFVSLCFSNLLLSWKNLSSVFATFHLVLADRRATARTTTFVEPCSIQTKKKRWQVDQSACCPVLQSRIKCRLVHL